MIKDGILNINKPQGMTSHDVVRDLRRLLGIKKIGHTGTLDPMATGVLPVCIGKATRVVEYMDMDFKTYRCTMMLGLITDTQDIWGEILEKRDISQITVAMVKQAFEHFHGEIEQLPPMYSAVRVDGRRLYDYARSGQTQEVQDKIKKRKIYIKKIEIETVDFPYDLPLKRVTFTVECSKGTYIRTICHEIGEILGCGAVMESLCRIKSGQFSLDEALDLDGLIESYSQKVMIDDRHYRVEQANPEAIAVIENFMLPVDYPLIHFGTAVLSQEKGKKFVDGWHISLSECKILEHPQYEEIEPEFEIRSEYRRAYKLYQENPMYPEKKEFLGVAFYNETYHKLVADKVFFRSEAE